MHHFASLCTICPRPTTTIATAVTYGGDGGSNVTALNKTDGGSAIPQFSFQLSDPTTLTTYGAVFLRSGSLASGSVTIRTTPTADASQAAGSYTAETYIFNDHDLITSDALTFDDGNGNVSTAATSFQYQDDSGLYDNGSPKWSKLTKVTNPDGSWVEYEYDDPETGPTTGWVTATLTPFESGTGNVETYGYDPSQSGNGQAPDPSLLVQPPDTVTDSLLGTQTGETFNNYQNPGYGSPKIITRQALSDNDPDWSKAGVFSTTTISAYDASDTESISGNLSEDKSGSGGGVSYATSTDWLGLQSSYTSDTYNAFGVLTSETAIADGQPNTSYNATSSDAFGRTTQASLSGGLTESFNYYDTDWFGLAVGE